MVNRPERFREGKLTLIMVSERTSERDGFRGFQRYSGGCGFSDNFRDFHVMFSGLKRFFECPLRAPLRVPFYSQNRVSCTHKSCCFLKFLQGTLSKPDRGESASVRVSERTAECDCFQWFRIYSGVWGVLIKVSLIFTGFLAIGEGYRMPSQSPSQSFILLSESRVVLPLIVLPLRKYYKVFCRISIRKCSHRMVKRVFIMSKWYFPDSHATV